MHNDRMFARVLRRGGRRLTGLALVSALVLTGCSGNDGSGGAEGDGSSASTATEPYLDVPDGVQLTAQGTELGIGEKATVAYEPRQHQVGALEVRVTRLEKATFRLFEGWKLSDETKKTTPYFLHAKVTNVGNTDLGGYRVPLYAVDGNNKLIESSTFQSTFKPCPKAEFPEKFKKGDSLSACLVYLAPDHGKVSAASFRPTEDFDPIVWTGEIGKVGFGGKDQGGKKDDGKKRG